MGNTWLLHVFFSNLGLLHVFLMSNDTLFIATLTLGLLHVFLSLLGSLHVFLMNYDTWIIAWVTPNLLHALLRTGPRHRPGVRRPRALVRGGPRFFYKAGCIYSKVKVIGGVCIANRIIEPISKFSFRPIS